jgi:hypothetical protein
MTEQLTRRYVILAVAALVLAAWTGVLMRFGMVYGFPTWAQNFGAVRHAHSHLMYFGWVTLALFALIWSDLPRHTGRSLPRQVLQKLEARDVSGKGAHVGCAHVKAPECGRWHKHATGLTCVNTPACAISHHNGAQGGR